MSVRVEHDDMLQAIPRLVAEGVVCDAVVTDPPYHLTPTLKRDAYSKYPRGKEAAFRDACAAAAICFNAGVPVFSPIAHTHYIAAYGKIDGGFTQWATFDEVMLRASDGMIVVKMDGWKDSVGIAAEIEICGKLGKPVLYVEAGGTGCAALMVCS